MKTFDPFDLRLVLLEEDVNVGSTGVNDDEEEFGDGEGQGQGQGQGQGGGQGQGT